MSDRTWLWIFLFSLMGLALVTTTEYYVLQSILPIILIIAIELGTTFLYTVSIIFTILNKIV